MLKKTLKILTSTRTYHSCLVIKLSHLIYLQPKKMMNDYKLVKICIKMAFEKRSEASAEEIIREAKELCEELMSL